MERIAGSVVDPDPYQKLGWIRIRTKLYGCGSKRKHWKQKIRPNEDKRFKFFIDLICMIIYIKAIVQLYSISTKCMENERFLKQIFKISWYWILFCLDPDPYLYRKFVLDQDPD